MPHTTHTRAGARAHTNTFVIARVIFELWLNGMLLISGIGTSSAIKCYSNSATVNVNVPGLNFGVSNSGSRAIEDNCKYCRVMSVIVIQKPYDFI